MVSQRALAALAISGIAFAGCSSSVGGVTPPPAPSSQWTATAQFVISVPVQKTSSAQTARRPQFDAPSNTQSVSIALTALNGAPQSNPSTIVNLNASAPGCTTANSTLTCTANVPAQSGTDTFTLKSFTKPNAGGTLISTGTAQVSIAAGQTSTTPVSVGGTVASIALAVPSTAIAGMQATFPLTVVAKDASGAVIMGSYSNPITLSDSDTSGATKLSVTTVGDSSAAAAVTLKYNGNALVHAATISASASNVAAAAITDATFTADSSYAPGNGATNTYTETLTWAATPAGGSTQTTSTVQTRSDSYATGASFNGMANLLDVHQVYPAVAPSTEVDSLDTYINLASTSSGVNAYEVGYERVNKDDSGTIVDEKGTYTGAGLLLAELPLRASIAWNSSAGYSTTASGSAGTSNGTYNADGSYTYSANDPGYSYTETVNADGSGSYKDGSGTTTFGVPAKSGTAYVIPVTAPGSTTPVMIPDWYPGNGAPPSPLLTDKTADKGNVSLPSQCTVPSSVGTKAELIEETISQLDPVYGTVLAGVSDTYYVNGIGPVCSILADTMDSYDNYVSGSLIEHDVLTWTDVLTSTATNAARTRSASASTAAATVPLRATIAVQHDRLVSLIKKATTRRAGLRSRV